MTDQQVEEDLALWRIRREEQRMVARSAALERIVSPEGSRTARDERLEDALRPSEVAAAWRSASAAPAAPEGESARRRFRLLAPAFLQRAVAEQQIELDACRATLRPTAPGFESEIVATSSAIERRRIHVQWVEYEARLAHLRRQRTVAAVAAARGAGADSLCGFLAQGHPVAVEALRDAYEVGAVTPLDEAVERASRDRRLRSPVALTEPEHAADSPVATALAGYGDRFVSSAISPVLRVLGRALGSDPDASGPGILQAGDACLRPRFWVTRSRAFVLIGALDGPAALAAALDAFGRSARHTFVSGSRGHRIAAAADPAFETAAGALFGRLLLSAPFRARFGPRPDPPLDLDLKLALALAPRLAWTYLSLALTGRGAEGEPPSGETERALRRALGRPPAVDQCLVPYACDPCGAAQLRGMALAVLLEERLMSRWDREWFMNERAGRFLRECWEAEAGQTAESVADGLDLGTIDPTPILDGCRP